MKTIASLACLLYLLNVNAQKNQIPFGYELLYSQNFSKESSINDFRFADVDQWSYVNNKSGAYLEFKQEGNYNPTVRSPRNICLLESPELGEFILDVSLQQTGREYGHRDMVIVFGFRDSTHYYYTHLATNPDSNAHNIFIVDGTNRVNLLPVQQNGINWNDNTWHKVRVQRNIINHTISVYFDDLSKPVLEVKDRTFIKGYVGFGSFDDSGKIDNIKLWSYTGIQKTANSFSKKIAE